MLQSARNRVFVALVRNLIIQPNVAQRFNGGHHAGVIGFGRGDRDDHFGHSRGSSGEVAASGARDGSGVELDRLLHRRQRWLQLGCSSRDLNFFNPLNGVLLASVSLRAAGDLNGGLFGGQIGYNWQTANWVFGIETDAQWTGQKGSTTVLCPVAGCFPTAVAAGTGVGAAISDKLEWFGTFRGRGGVLVTPSVLLYVTGGLAYGSLQTEVGLSGFTATGIPVTAIGSRSRRQIRLDRRWWHRGDVRRQLERQDRISLYGSRLDQQFGGSSDRGRISSRGNRHQPVTDSIIRGGISYHFSYGPGPVVARY